MAYAPESGHTVLFELAIDTFAQCFPNTITSEDSKARLLQGNVAMDKSLGWRLWDRLFVKHTNVFSFQTRARNWHFIHSQRQHLAKVGVINQSMSKLWELAQQGLQDNPDQHDKLLFVGAIAHLLEDATVPAHIVPVYHGPTAIKHIGPNQLAPLVRYMQQNRPENKFAIHDQVDKYAIDKQSVQNAIDCESISTSGQPLPELLQRNEFYTRRLLQTPIPDCPEVSWQVFWSPPEADSYFGRYHIENDMPLFGQHGEIKDPESQTSTCRLEKNDKRYREFLHKLHLQAVNADIQLLLWFYNQ
ncbi:hypothetical protein GCM10009114_09790 [Aliiglaciecola litoralis]|uniref:Phospholipase C/D domain-containing protein n=2 Tax=Aliiglaciecola litoralis TaxID=582857 RepID=A0ABP3WT39_9ALTE